MRKYDMAFGQVQVMEFLWHLLRKWWHFHRIWCHFRPNCRQKGIRKSKSRFWQGTLFTFLLEFYYNNSKIECIFSETRFEGFKAETTWAFMRVNPVFIPLQSSQLRLIMITGFLRPPCILYFFKHEFLSLFVLLSFFNSVELF